ncbi:MAG: hypothetical protein ACTS6P_01865 [Candidatus Hodgkinia cicadicola]
MRTSFNSFYAIAIGDYICSIVSQSHERNVPTEIPQLRWHGSLANEVNFRPSQRSASTAKPRPLRLSRGRRRLFSIPQVNLRSSSCGIVIKPNH